MIKAIIFDCFGVLVGAGFWAVYESLGGDLSKDSEFVDSLLNKLNSGKMQSGDFSVIMADKLGVTLDEYQTAYNADEVPNRMLFEYIRYELKPNYKLALISNATGNSVRRKIPESEMALFDEVLLSGEVGLLKPDSKLFRLALDKLGVEPNEAIFVDDHEPYVSSANSLGIHGILFKNVTDLKQNLELLQRKG